MGNPCSECVWSSGWWCRHTPTLWHKRSVGLSYNIILQYNVHIASWPDDTADPEALSTPPVHIAAGHPSTFFRTVADPRQPGDEDIVRNARYNIPIIATLLMILCRDCWGTWSLGVGSEVCWFCQSLYVCSLCFRWGLLVTRVHIVQTQETVYKPAWWFLDWHQPRLQHAFPSVHNVQMCWPVCSFRLYALVMWEVWGWFIYLECRKMPKLLSC